MTYEELIRKIGPGFHPDTRGYEYASLPDGVTAEEVENVVNEAHQEGNAYTRAWNVFILEGWIEIAAD